MGPYLATIERLFPHDSWGLYNPRFMIKICSIASSLDSAFESLQERSCRLSEKFACFNASLKEGYLGTNPAVNIDDFNRDYVKYECLKSQFFDTIGMTLGETVRDQVIDAVFADRSL